jgi:hypothetical protein
MISVYILYWYICSKVCVLFVPTGWTVTVKKLHHSIRYLVATSEQKVWGRVVKLFFFSKRAVWFCLSVCLSIYLSIYLLIYLASYLSIYLSIYLLSIHVSSYLSISTFMSMSPSIYLSSYVCPSIFLSILQCLWVRMYSHHSLFTGIRFWDSV